MKRRTLILLAILAISILFIYCVVDAAPTIPKRDFTSQSTYKVLRVIDGDTVELLIDGKATIVRMIGVDTPETVHPQKPVEHYGKEASMFTANLLKGKEVYIELEQNNTVGKYGRTLLYLYRVPDGLFVNLEIVRQGYGHAYTVYPFQHMELFKHYEDKAKELGKGLWAPVTQANIATPGSEQEEEPQDIIVYITRTGKKYHRGNCRYLSKSKIPTKLSQAKRRYGACSVCNPPR